MTVSTIECGFCDVEFDVMYTEEAEIKYCPFCGEDLEEFDEETGCMSVTFPDGAKETNCPDGTGFFVDPGGMRIDRVFDESTGCVTETFSDGVSEVFCPEEELSLIN